MQAKFAEVNLNGNLNYSQNHYHYIEDLRLYQQHVPTNLAYLYFYYFGRMDKTNQIQGTYIYLDALKGSILGLLEAKSLTVQRTAAATYYYNMFHNNL